MIRLIAVCYFLFIGKIVFAQKSIYLKFEAIANCKKIVLNDSSYTNAFGEKYTVSKLKFYVSNLYFVNHSNETQHKNIFLIDTDKTDSIKFKSPKKNVNAIAFQIGIDSILNCSGAQAGALDPLNDMFWTWNSGYVSFKLEGTSTSSNADKQRIEQHIGGYRIPFATQQRIQFLLPFNYFEKNNTVTIQIDLDKYWDGENKISIAKMPVIASPGIQAKHAADNFIKMFTLKNEN